MTISDNKSYSLLPPSHPLLTLLLSRSTDFERTSRRRLEMVEHPFGRLRDVLGIHLFEVAFFGGTFALFGFASRTIGGRGEGGSLSSRSQRKLRSPSVQLIRARRPRCRCDCYVCRSCLSTDRCLDKPGRSSCTSRRSCARDCRSSGCCISSVGPARTRRVLVIGLPDFEITYQISDDFRFRLRASKGRPFRGQGMRLPIITVDIIGRNFWHTISYVTVQMFINVGETKIPR